MENCNYCEKSADTTNQLVIHRSPSTEDLPKLCVWHLLMCIEARPNSVKSWQETHGNILYTHHYLPEFFKEGH